ncbi:MAG TPA: ABC transporter substrate-binding protein [Actinomycetota bacterium]|nr:ABC transporter substrate-binding protein [Actinomycetota bacterium]
MRGHLKWFVLLVAMLLITAACGGSEPDDPADEGDAPAGATMAFGTSADPVVLDGALVSDGESLRAIDQMFEGLVTLDPGTTEVVAGLAESWDISEDAQTYTFQLHDGVTFHDGEPLNAEAVCYNFDRWYNFPKPFQQADATYYYQTVFGGFKGNPDALYDSCTATDELTVELKLTKPSASLLGALALTNFTIASPKALEQYGADEGKINADSLFQATGTYGTQHPTGTGPFKFVEWNRGDRLVMERNEDYWGEFPGNIDTLIFRPIADGAARLQALQTGEIQGYDLVDPQDFETIQGDENLQLLERPAFNVGYIGFNQAIEPFDDIAVRQAIAHAVDRQEIVDAFYAGQGEVAHEFMPPEVEGYADDVTKYEYDPEKAKQLLQDAGHTLPVQIDFAYPTDVSRPYMPDPQANFEAIVSDLEECCFKVETKSATWSPDYLGNVDVGKYGSYLLGWTGDYADADNFIGTFFQTKQPAWGFDNQEVFDCLNEAELEIDPDARVGMYEECNRIIMDFLPGLPYVHTGVGLAFTANVEGYRPSPVTLEPFSIVTVNE